MGKRLVAVLLCLGIWLIGMTGCRTDEIPLDSVELRNDFSLTAELNYQDSQIKASVTKRGGISSLVISEPRTLQGMTLESDGSSAQIVFGGIAIHLDGTQILKDSVYCLIFECIDHALLGSGVVIGSDGDVFTLSGTNESGAYQIRADKKTGMPLELKIPSKNFRCKFSNAEEQPSGAA